MIVLGGICEPGGGNSKVEERVDDRGLLLLDLKDLKDQKAIKSAAETFRQNPKYSVEQVITELGVGEALISFLDEKGRPSIVEKAFVIPPRSKIGPIAPERRKEITDHSNMGVRYEKPIDRESAYELLQAKALREKEEKSHRRETCP